MRGRMRERLVVFIAVAIAAALVAPVAAFAAPAGKLVTRRGTVVVTAIDLMGRSLRTRLSLSTPDALIELRADGATEQVVRAHAHEQVEVTGRLQGDELAVESVKAISTSAPDGGRSAAAAQEPRTVHSGNRTLNVVMLTFQLRPEFPAAFTAQQATNLLKNNPNSLAAFVDAQSGGTLKFTSVNVQSTVLGPQYDPLAAGCEATAYQIYNTYLFQGYDSLPTTHTLLVGPDLPECPFSAFASFDGRLSYYDGTLSPWVTTHEIGHNLGFEHARALDCNAPNYITPICPVVEYGDFFDVMGAFQNGGNGACSYSVWNRKQIGWPVDLNLHSSGDLPKQYTLRAADLPDDPNPAIHQGLRAFGGPANWGGQYTFEWQARAFPHCKVPQNAEQGLIVRQARSFSAGPLTTYGTYLIDNRPQTDSVHDALIRVGETFRDPTSELRVRLDSIDMSTGHAKVTASYYGYASVVGNEVRFMARPGDANNLLVETSNGGATWFITERNGHPIKGFPSSGCAIETTSRVRCNAPAGSKAVIDVADGNDTVELAANAPAVVFGGDGNDTFPQRATPNGGAEYHGGAGSDTVDYSARTQHVEVWQDNGANDGYRATAHGPVLEGDNIRDDIETLIGGSAFDFLIGSGVDNLIIGNAGQDPTWGGDHIYGNGGNDLILGGDGGDYLNGGDGDDTIFGDEGWDALVGESGNDTLNGGIGGDNLFGGDGNDQLDGGTGPDTLDGGAGIDLVDYSARTNAVIVTHDGLANDGESGEGDNVVGSENILGGNGDDILLGVATGSFLFGGGGNDILWAGDANDVLVGGPGNDTYLAGGGNDVLWDSIFGAPADGNDHMNGGAGHDNLDGGIGTDTYIGGLDDDTISANDGGADPAINCGPGTDVATYDALVDTFAAGSPPGGCETRTPV